MKQNKDFNMKNIIILTIAIMLAGCDGYNLSEPQVIKHVYRIDRCFCSFNIIGDQSPKDFGNRTEVYIYFTDSCTKFQIGDTVNFKPCHY